MTVHGYAYADIDGPALDTQRAALTAAGCASVVSETGHGSPADRPRLAHLLADLGSGDMLIVGRLAELARSTRDLRKALDAVTQRGAAFRSLAEPWADTTVLEGRLLLTVLGGLATFERDLQQARTRTGRQRTQTRGQPMGRPPALTPEQRQEALAGLAAGTATQAALAQRFGVSQATISRLTRAVGAAPPAPAAPMLDADTDKAARAFLRHLDRRASRYAIKEVLLYGSRARGTHTPDSDADLAVVLAGEPGDRYQAARDLGDAAYDALLETGVYVSPLPLWESELQRPALFSNPALIETIRREGLRL